MRDFPPSTPLRSRASPSVTQSPHYRSSTSIVVSPHTGSGRQAPSASQARVRSAVSPGLSALSEPPVVSGATTSWLSEHIPLPQNTDSESILGALIASRAALARNCRQQQASTNYGLEWDWYIKDVSRRKLMYGQVTHLLIGLVSVHTLHRIPVWADLPPRQCSLLELTTDATVFLYCARPERSPNDGERGRAEVSYTNLRALQDVVGADLRSDLMMGAETLGDHLAKDWRNRQDAYDRNSRKLITHAMRSGSPAHRPGDFPLLTRFDGRAADGLLRSLAQFDWSLFGVVAPSLTMPETLDPGLSSPSHGSFSQPPRRGWEEPSPVSGTSSSGIYVVESDGENEDDEAISPGTSTSTFVGRRARLSDHTLMKTLGLTKLQRLEVRIVLWEVEPDGWYDALKPMFQANSPALFALLHGLASHT